MSKPHPNVENAWIIRWRVDGRKGKQHYLTLCDCDEAKAKAIEMNLHQKTGGVIHTATCLQLIHVFP